MRYTETIFTIDQLLTNIAAVPGLHVIRLLTSQELREVPVFNSASPDYYGNGEKGGENVDRKSRERGKVKKGARVEGQGEREG